MTDYPSMGPYKLLEPVGKGGQGSVWLARDTRNGSVVALKMLRPDSQGTIEVARFRREAEILTGLTDPGLPACLHLIEQPEGKPIALAMEYIKGTPLTKARRQRRLSPREVRAIGCELARIVGVLHGKGLVHRDLKTSNIILRQGWENGIPGSVVVVDLGIAKGTSRHATGYTDPGFVVGSVAYLAPEYFSSKAASPEASMCADVFSIGVLLWLLLFDQHPTGLSIRSAVLDLMEAYAENTFTNPEPSLAAAIERNVPGLISVARRCTAYDPTHRYAHAREVYDALKGLSSSAGNTKVCVEPAQMSYNVAIHPRPKSDRRDSGEGWQGNFPACPTMDLDSEAPTCMKQFPEPERTLDEPMSETIAALREQFADLLEDTEILQQPEPETTLPIAPTPAPPAIQTSEPSSIPTIVQPSPPTSPPSLPLSSFQTPATTPHHASSQEGIISHPPRSLATKQEMSAGTMIAIALAVILVPLAFLLTLLAYAALSGKPLF